MQIIITDVSQSHHGKYTMFSIGGVLVLSLRNYISNYLSNANLGHPMGAQLLRSTIIFDVVRLKERRLNDS